MCAFLSACICALPLAFSLIRMISFYHLCHKESFFLPQRKSLERPWSEGSGRRVPSSPVLHPPMATSKRLFQIFSPLCFFLQKDSSPGLKIITRHRGRFRDFQTTMVFGTTKEHVKRRSIWVLMMILAMPSMWFLKITKCYTNPNPNRWLFFTKKVGLAMPFQKTEGWVPQASSPRSCWVAFSAVNSARAQSDLLVVQIHSYHIRPQLNHRLSYTSLWFGIPQIATG